MKLAIVLFLISLLVRFVMIQTTGFEGLYGQDAFAYLNYSQELGQALANFEAPPPFFWPIGYPLLVVISSLAAGNEHMAGQLTSVISGALVAPLVYLIVLELRPLAQFGGFVVGLLAAFSAQLMLSSLSVMSDAVALFWITFSAWAMTRYFGNMGLLWLALSAFALGWAVLTRWVYVLAALPWAISVLAAWRASRLSWRKAVPAATVAVLVSGLLVTFPLLPGALRGEVPHAGNFQVHRWNPSNAFKSDIENFDGHFQYERPMAIFYALPAVHPAFLFPLMLPFLILGLWQAVHLERRHALLIVGWPLAFYIFLSGVPLQNARFSLAYYPPLLVITAFGLQQAWNWLRFATRHSQLSTRHPPPVTPYLLVSLVGLALAGSLAWSFRQVGDFASWNQSRIDAAAWAEAQVPAGATLVSFDLTATLNHYTKLDVEELYSFRVPDLAALSQETSPLYLLLDVDNVESQWQGKSPHTNYEWLHDSGQLTEIDRFPPYTLFSVEQP